MEIRTVKREVKKFANRLRTIIQIIKRTSAYDKNPEELAQLQDDILACHLEVKRFLENNRGQYDEMSRDAMFLWNACEELLDAAKEILYYEMIIKNEDTLDMLKDVVVKLMDIVNWPASEQ